MGVWQGFGAGNFKALFESIEMEQNERGNLFYETIENGGRRIGGGAYVWASDQM